MKKLQIAVFGSDSDHCSEKAKKIAKEVGKEIARAGAILLTGGGEGVMKSASEGAHKENGIVIGILPGADKRDANAYCNIIIPTEIGFARGQVLANAADAAIVIEGAFGPRNEVGETYWRLIPTIAIPSSGGTAAEVANTYLDKRRIMKVGSQESAQEAVKEAVRLARNRLGLQERLSAVGQDLSIYRTTPQKYIRINPRNPIEIRALERKLQEEYRIEIFFEETGIPHVYRSSCENIGGLIGDRRNNLLQHYIIQDLASIVAMQALEIEKGNSYLELGAAPEHWQGKQYDRVVIGAPCSCEGMIVKYDKELQRDVGGINKVLEFSQENIEKLQEEQRKLLQNGFKHLRRKGKLLYVTCTLNRNENEDVIAAFLEDNSTARIDLPRIDNEDVHMQVSDKGIRVIPRKTKGLYFTRIIKE